MIELRTATESDISGILDIVEEADNESFFKGDYDRWTASYYLQNFIDDDHSVIMLATKDGEIMGAVIMAASWEFWKKPIAYVVKFWIKVAGRRTRAARLLVGYIEQFAREHECTDVYATATAELDEKEQRLFENLFYKNGFSNVGATMRKGF